MAPMTTLEKIEFLIYKIKIFKTKHQEVLQELEKSQKLVLSLQAEKAALSAKVQTLTDELAFVGGDDLPPMPEKEIVGSIKKK